MFIQPLRLLDFRTAQLYFARLLLTISLLNFLTSLIRDKRLILN